MAGKSFERVFYNAEVRQELNISERLAREFLSKFGVRMGRWYAITQGEFRWLQLTGEAAKWLADAERHTKQGGRNDKA